MGHLKKQNIILCRLFPKDARVSANVRLIPRQNRGEIGGELKAIPSATHFSVFLREICWDLLWDGLEVAPLQQGGPGGAQVTPHAPLQTWPCGVLKEKANCTRQAD